MKICSLFPKYFFKDESVKLEKILNLSIPFHFPMNRGEINKGERGPPARSSRKISLELSSQSQLD